MTKNILFQISLSETFSVDAANILIIFAMRIVFSIHPFILIQI